MSEYISVVWAFLASLGFCYIFNIREPKKIFWASLGGGMSWFVYLMFNGWFATDIPQYFIAMAAASLYSEVMARVHKSPATIYLVIAFIPLVPGSGAYYAMEHAINGETDLFLEVGIHTLSIAGALAMGIILVSSLTRIATKYSFYRKMKKRQSAAGGNG